MVRVGGGACGAKVRLPIYGPGSGTASAAPNLGTGMMAADRDIARTERVSLAAGLALIILGLAGAAQAQQADWQGRGLDPSREYSDCMAQAREDPEAGLERAFGWRDLGGGDPARHCIAIALIGLKRYEDAARRLEALAQEISAENEGLRPAILAQAAQVWHLADQLERALAVQDAAVNLAPEDGELRIERAITLATLGRFWDAVDDLNRAFDLTPDRPEILALRASAYRHLEVLDLARDDIERALALAPDDPNALLERGMLRRLAGDPAAARNDWLRVIALAEGQPQADAARAALARLDVQGE